MKPLELQTGMIRIGFEPLIGQSGPPLNIGWQIGKSTAE